MTTELITEQPRFWSDDFDMDLLKVLPNLIEVLGATVDVRLWTVGYESFGRLNCPIGWDGDDYQYWSYIWLDKPNLVRDKHGWFNVGGCVSDAKEIECTWLEWLRDAWSHKQNWTLLPSGKRFRSCDYDRSFYPIMSYIRKWSEWRREDVDLAYRIARLWVVKANRRFAKAVEDFQLGREDYPYFAKGSVPGFNAQPVRLLEEKL